MHRVAVAVLVAVAVAAAAAGAALAVGPSLWVVNGKAIAAPGSGVRFVARLESGGTRVETIRSRNGAVVASTRIEGKWGFQAVTLAGDLGGLSADGRVLVLAKQPPAPGALRQTTPLTVIRTRGLAVERVVRLRGDFSFDALSPGGRTLYLIQHLAGGDVTRYRVRAYDLRAGRLLPRVIADRREGEWTMRGYPVARALSRGARWVYTLYQPSTGNAFVHALGTVARSAVCIDLPFGARALDSASVSLSSDGRTLVVTGPHVRRPVEIDTRTLRIRS